jgi:hypothetical protein
MSSEAGSNRRGWHFPYNRGVGLRGTCLRRRVAPSHARDRLLVIDFYTGQIGFGSGKVGIFAAMSLPVRPRYRAGLKAGKNVGVAIQPLQEPRADSAVFVTVEPSYGSHAGAGARYLSPMDATNIMISEIINGFSQLLLLEDPPRLSSAVVKLCSEAQCTGPINVAQVPLTLASRSVADALSKQIWLYPDCLICSMEVWRVFYELV